MIDENNRMLAQLRETLDWFREPTQRRQISRRLANRMYALLAIAVRVIMWLAIFVFALYLDAWLAWRTHRESNLLVVLLIVLGILAFKIFWPRLKTSFRKLLRRTELLPAVILAAMGGGSIAWLSWWGLRKILHPTTKSPDPIDITKLALTIAGGVGAVVALVVAYRRQRDVEQGRFVERFGAAAAQLGANQVAVRIAGVYAMAGVANESKGLQRQQCIDVLCGYLRLPYSPERGSNYQTKHVMKSKDVADAALETEDHFEYLQNDREVRRTILHVIADHLRSYEFSWSTVDFDFRGAHLEDVDFSYTVFKSAARFMGARFIGEANFQGSRLTGWPSFDDCIFEGGANFDSARIREATLKGATFEGETSFCETEFDEGANFAKASFGGVRFIDCSFSGHRTDFREVTFNGETVFDGTVAGYCDFSEAAFRDKANFYASFQFCVKFEDVDFGSEEIDFERVRKWVGGRWARSKFDWSENRSLKPPNVKPDVWPNDFP
ncbi:pentapeptide repeat-containing protein [Nocardia sp. N2S4-5]|uniref:pentapeptide repeat-containing protein n=1 Tax=Nocardia sp. N2S4-5 TaxID=3351565 RepID=UPI0037D17615